jgi:hypothetical protein
MILVPLVIGALLGSLLYLAADHFGFGYGPIWLWAGIAAFWLFGDMNDADDEPTKEDMQRVAQDLTTRILAVKVSKMTGPMAGMMADGFNNIYEETSKSTGLRTELKNAAYATSEDWRHFAHIAYKTMRNHPDELYQEFRLLATIADLGETRIEEPVVDVLVEIAQIWKIGPKTLANTFKELNIPFSAKLRKLIA